MYNKKYTRTQGKQRGQRNLGLKQDELERQERLKQVPTSGPGFINPYNFVSFGPQDRPAVRLEPVSHENFSGLSGQIVCELTNLTPLCVPDPEATREIEVQVGSLIKERKQKPFMTINNFPTLPGSSLKGMLRNVIEALTDSCMSILTENMAIFRDNRRWVPEARRVGWVRVTKEYKPVRMDDPQVSGGVTAIRFPRRGLFNQINRSYSPRNSNQAAQGERIPEEVLNLYEKMIEDDNFTLKENGREARLPKENEKKWLKKFTANKDDSYWWFRTNSNNKVIEFGRNFRYKWAYDPRQAVAERYHPCHDPSNGLCPACSLFGMAGESNQPGEEGQVRALAGRVHVSIAEWLGQGESLDKKPELEWVNDLKILGAPHISARSFYLHPSRRGRFYLGRRGTLDEVTELAEEYLETDAQGKLVPTPARGRKFYWHHTKVWDGRDLNYIQLKPGPNGRRPRTDQNSRVQVLMPGGHFRFTVHFENLQDWELGLLLWGLTLPDVARGAHHLGLGKPVGMGSCQINVKDVILVDRKRRYEQVADLGLLTQEHPGIDQQAINSFVDILRQKLIAWFGAQIFAKIPHVRDLLIILSQEQPLPAGSDVPICYPPGLRSAQSEPEQGDPMNPEEVHYSWFGGKGEDWSQALLTIEQIRQNGRQLRAKEG